MTKERLNYGLEQKNKDFREMIEAIEKNLENSKADKYMRENEEEALKDAIQSVEKGLFRLSVSSLNDLREQLLECQELINVYNIDITHYQKMLDYLNTGQEFIE